MKIKALKISLIILLITGLSILMFYVLNNDSEKEYKIIDCEESYEVENPQPGFLDFSKSNAKKRVAVCLCEKYLQNREEKYKIEILKLYNDVGMMYPSYEKGNKIDSVCNNRKYVFLELSNL
ncbi:hypothetical protein MKJ01_04010 [Chryseobacterium sp. SSA4.19]|uniref:hypothetical protein n=1 Tax=Chryseobacterium sp. SSA4.19 TaxID=2919915 RepID=UPI001F4DEC66|nr:hypothetical protein [Chryseobacterium sp. SSA4.19]MCJ8152927.1 hypothetical protein [Chryseobacterium sp. SSA4.19]